MTTISMQIWNDRKNEWTEPETITHAKALQVLREHKLFPEEELDRLLKGLTVNCGIVTLHGVLDVPHWVGYVERERGF